MFRKFNYPSFVSSGHHLLLLYEICRSGKHVRLHCRIGFIHPARKQGNIIAFSSYLISFVKTAVSCRNFFCHFYLYFLSQIKIAQGHMVEQKGCNFLFNPKASFYNYVSSCRCEVVIVKLVSLKIIFLMIERTSFLFETFKRLIIIQVSHCSIVMKSFVKKGKLWYLNVTIFFDS